MDMYKQYQDLKSMHPDAVLLFRTGNHYEAYEEDAILLSGIFEIDMGHHFNDGKTMMTIRFPHYDLDTYLPKIIRAGHRVAICDQLEDPNTKKLVKRGAPADTPPPPEKVTKPSMEINNTIKN